MNNRFLAKSKPVETIAEHTERLQKNYALLKDLFPDVDVDWELLLLAVRYHDIGKINTRFQNKLYKQLGFPLLEDRFENEDEIPHGNLSAALLDGKQLKERFDPDAVTILYQAVYYHHPRFINKDKPDYFKAVVKEDLERYTRDTDFGLPYFNRELRFDISKYIRNRIDYTEGNERLFHRYVMTKGLLNRLDYAASAHVDVEVPNSDLEERTLAFLKEKGGLRDIQKYMLEHRNENNVVVASTGIGKTEAGLLWIGNNKGFFTLPLRVSINAIYRRIKDGEIGFRDTALLHSDALAFLVKRDETTDYMKEYSRARLLSMPLTITTVDQLFKFVFKQEGFEQIPSTLSYSKLIIDEIQMYSPEIVACILMGLMYITELGGRFSILTATFPKILDTFLKELGITYNYSEFILDKKRHKIKVVDDDIAHAVGDIVEKGRHSSVLVIVNTVKKAQQLYDDLGDIDYKYLLHSRFIKRDRRRLEGEIMGFGFGKRTGIWVATQIVEASLDIDFDYLFTELSTVDGLFQRMGRCYRKRELDGGGVNVFVYTKNPSGVGTIIDRDIFELSKGALPGFDNRVISEKEKLAVVQDVYSFEKISKTGYYKGIRKRLNLLREIPAYEFERGEVDAKFRNIMSHTVFPISVYNDNIEKIENAVESLAVMEFSADRVKLLESLKDLTVDVPHFLGKSITGKISIDRWNTFKIIDLPYDPCLGLLPEGGSSNFL